MVQLFYGDNSFALHEKRQSLIADFLSAHDAFGLEKLDGEEITNTTLRSAVLQLPFLVDRKLVIITSLFHNKNSCDELLKILNDIPDEVHVVLFDSKPDKRMKLFKTLSAQTSVTEFTSLKGAQLIQWTISYAKTLGAGLDKSCAELLINRVGPHQSLLAKEIEKLAVHSVITKDIILDNTQESLETTIFELLETTFKGKQDKAMLTLEMLYKISTDPHEIMSLVAWQLHLLAIAVANPHSSSSDIATRYKVHPFVAGKAVEIARGMSRKQLLEVLDISIAADLKLKTSSGRPEDVLRVLILELTSLF